MRKGVVLSLGLVGIVLAAWLVAAAILPGWRINAVTANFIKPGMTLEEIEAVLGAPPGDYSFKRETTFTTLGRRIGQHSWKTDFIVIVVNLDPRTERAGEIRVQHRLLD